MYVLPVVIQGAKGRRISVTKQRIFAIVVLLLLLTVAAGVVALTFDSLNRAEAITVGFMSQSMFKGLLSGARDSIPPSSRAN